MDLFSLPFVQHALWELLLLAVGAGVLGPWIVLRGLSFYAHGVAAATFPGLVLAAGLGFAGPLGALAVALLFAGTVGRFAARGEQGEHSTVTAMVLVGALVVGVVLASDVFPLATTVNALLFGSLLVISDRDLVIAAAVSALVVALAVPLAPRWLAVGFDRDGSRALGVRGGLPDAALLVLVALVAVSALSAVGSLLAAAVMVIPAATVRPWVQRMGRWQLATLVLTAATGVAGLWLSARTNAPPGATIAVLAGTMFLLSALIHAAVRRRRDRRGLLGAAAAATLVLGAAGCGSVASSDGDADAGGRISVVATTSQLGDLVREVGGDAVDVHQILRPSTDPHEYEPRPTDVTATADARVVVASGLGIDGWIDDVRRQSGSDAPLVRVGDALPVREDAHAEDAREHDDHAHESADEHAAHDHDHGHGHEHPADGRDPHWWHDPRDVVVAVGEIRDALVRADPQAAAAIRASADAYVRRVRALDARIVRCIGRIPPAERKIVTSHDAFGAFARRYDLRIIGAVIPSQTTRAQASAGDVSRLTALIRRERVRAIFPESSVNPKLARSIAQETGATADRTLYGDTLGDPGTDGDTYLGMLQHNADAVVRGLTGGREHCGGSAR